jgi:hypothetical protein
VLIRISAYRSVFRYCVTLVSAGLILAGIAVLPATAADAASTPVVLPPDSNPFGQTYGQWSAAWWQWGLAISVHNPPGTGPIHHPLFITSPSQDPAGALCAVGQSGPVWFLGGAYGATTHPSGNTNASRNCAVPANTALFFPIANVECSTAEGSLNLCSNKIKDEAAIATSDLSSVTSMSVTLDQSALPTYRALSPLFGFTIPADNVFANIGEIRIVPGTYSLPQRGAASDGYYLMLAPLSPGSHTLQISASFETLDFSFRVTYNLTVQ